MVLFLAFLKKAKVKTHTTQTTQHQIDRGLGGVRQRFTVEGARTACALPLATLTVPRAIAPLMYAEPADLWIYSLPEKYAVVLGASFNG